MKRNSDWTFSLLGFIGLLGFFAFGTQEPSILFYFGFFLFFGFLEFKMKYLGLLGILGIVGIGFALLTNIGLLTMFS